jgi:hypothetical protein
MKAVRMWYSNRGRCGGGKWTRTDEGTLKNVVECPVFKKFYVNNSAYLFRVILYYHPPVVRVALYLMGSKIAATV